MIVNATFSIRARGISSDLRLFGRLTILLISIDRCCWRKVANLEQLHILNTLFLKARNGENYLNRDISDNPGAFNFNIDPYLNKCIQYALAYGLIERTTSKSGYSLFLTTKGTEYLKVLQDSGEIDEYMDIGMRIGVLTRSEINRLTKG
ncbi:MAG: hypothetical protein J0L55_02305 [Caulobacterales bacterium]|nr:hypothetical protein [Caulobacterales bacterium]MCA0372165.1 hypothetical protein [Pseudomonadota bacterium]